GDRGGQGLFGRLGQAGGVDRADLAFGLLEQVADALVGGRQAGGLGQLAEGGDGAHARGRLVQRRRQRDHGVDRIAVEIGGQLVAVALVDKGAHFVRRGGRDLAGREGAGSQRQQAVERQGAVGAGGQQAARRQLFERADQAQRGAAQAER